MESQKVFCEFGLMTVNENHDEYMCKLKAVIIKEDCILEPFGDHLDGRTNKDVAGVSIERCMLSKIPQGLTKMFPNMKYLSIHRTSLKSIVREDFIEYSQITHLGLVNNEIDCLPNDLLTEMKHLKTISFDGNKFQKIGNNIFDELKEIKFIGFLGVPQIDKCYDDYYGDIKSVSLEALKAEIREKFKEAPAKKKNKRKNKKQQQQNAAAVVESNDDDEEEVQEICETGILSNLKKILQNDKLKDFTVKVADENFKVHKLILAARCPVFAEMIENNIDADCLQLINMSKDVFREILNFIYTDRLPKAANINYKHLFAAAARLQIEDLKNFASDKLILEINAENALEILILANKYESDSLQQKSFEIIKESLKEVKITDAMAKQPEKLKKLLEMKRKKEEMMRQMREIDEEFKQICN